jgi:hypothetical protein
MGVRTGKPRGRPAGAKSSRTEEREVYMQRAAEQIESILPQAFKGDAHTLLMTVYKDETQPWERRLDAAKAAAPYEKPRLSSIEAKVDVGLTEMDDDDLDSRLGALAAQAGIALSAGGEGEEEA